ncbi:peptide ABC transporter permease [Vallitalea longa]|uniref:Peptide ABC transporter permease n=1 Tax=Vallitalea longa TaxID=2936439 RepID=A0A9W5YDL4_9FIRM|nr:ABC transporter permease [Vallitalea longa]GKX29278.1 peptide ABC transporter permease [Vallitalea longa]
MSLNKEIKHERIISPTRLMFIKFRANRLAMFGFWIFIAIVIFVLGFKLYTVLINYDFANLSEIGEGSYTSPNSEHWFGTDKYGRDYFYRVITGGYIALKVAVLSTLMIVVIGVIFGAISGYFGGYVDVVLMRIAEIVISFPFLALAIAISAMFADYPDETRLFIMIFIIGLLGWPSLARMVRGQILSLKEQEFMTATKVLGISTRKQITKHLIPNVIAYVIVAATINFATSIMLEASLSYLGLSVKEPVATWGGLLQRASTSVVMKNYWWLWVFPGILLFLLVMSVNLIGEGLRDAVDPKSEVIKKISLFSRIGRFFSKTFGGAKGGESIRS